MITSHPPSLLPKPPWRYVWIRGHHLVPGTRPQGSVSLEREHSGVYNGSPAWTLTVTCFFKASFLPLLCPRRERSRNPSPVALAGPQGLTAGPAVLSFRSWLPSGLGHSGLCLSACRAAEPPGSSGFLERMALGEGHFKQKCESGFPRPRASSLCVLPLPCGNSSSATAAQISLADSGLPRAQRSGIRPEIGHLPSGRFCAK